MRTQHLITVIKHNIGHIIFNRPDVHNAFDDVMIRSLHAALEKFEKDDTVRVVKISANGKSFSAGADLAWMQRVASFSHDENVKDATALSDCLHLLKFLKKPVIAEIQGPAFGGGVGMVACCDIAIASVQATFCFSEVRVGLIPAVISPYVIAAIGERAARRYFLTAELMSADDAARLGLIHHVVSQDKLENATQKIIDCLLANGTQAVQNSKQLINRVSAHPYDPSHRQKNIEAIASARASKEGQVGMRAFLEKNR